ncbi:MAG: NAD(+)/NADH kinase [Nanoarchaeota archaeon]|nr:NAD(+)/NADH kinase [Nanoarchaeota archaeon]MCA9495758.1 NAD(+)/NADH kinase [Nanoarchaeota archaeon]
MDKKLLIVEKYTSYEYSKLNGILDNISKSRLKDLEKSHKEHKAVKENILSILDKYSFKYDIIKDDNVSKIKYLDYKYIMSLGGDGTVLHASSNISKQIFLAVNTDLKKSSGYLTKLNINNVELAIKSLVKKKAKFDYFSRISAKLNGKKLPFIALNEVLISDPRIYKTTHLEVEVNGQKSKTISNGILISSKQGSYAFYNSSGGKPFEQEKIAYNIIMPYKFDGNLEKNAILSLETKIIIRPKREHYKILFDCQESKSIDLKQGDEIEVKIDKKNDLKVLIV